MRLALDVRGERGSDAMVQPLAASCSKWACAPQAQVVRRTVGRRAAARGGSRSLVGAPSAILADSRRRRSTAENRLTDAMALLAQIAKDKNASGAWR